MSEPLALADVEVVLISGGFQPNYERGFANGLAAQGARVTLVTSDLSLVQTLHPAVRAINLRGSQSPGRPVWTKALNLIRYHLRLGIWLARHRPAVVHMFGLIEPTWLAGTWQGLWLRLTARRYVLTVHNLRPHEAHRPSQVRAYGRAYRLAHVCVVHTARMADGLTREHAVPRARIVLMPHGVEPLPPVQGPRPAVAADGPLRLLAFGNLSPYKGLDLLLDALRELPPRFALHIAGHCRDDRLRRQILAQLDRHPAAARITWHDGYVPEDEVPPLLAQADALVLPYRRIDESGVRFQAMRHGVPVIAARVGALADEVAPPLGVGFDAGSTDALVRALLDFEARRDEFAADAIRSHAAARQWHLTVRALRAAYCG